MDEFQQQNSAPGQIEGSTGPRTDEDFMQSVGTSLATGIAHDETRTGIISTTFENTISAPRTRTAYPQEYGPERLTSSIRPVEGPSRAIHIGNPFHSTMDPRLLMVNTNAAYAAVAGRPGYDDAIFDTPLIHVSGDNASGDVENLYSPLRHRLEGLELPASSPVVSTSPSSPAVSYPETVMAQQDFYGLLNGQYQWPQEGHLQYHIPQMYPVPYYGTNPYALTPDEGTSAQSMTQVPVLGHEALGSNIYNPAGPSSPVWQSTYTGCSSQGLSGVTTASDSLSARHPFNPSTETPSQVPPQSTGPSAPRKVQPRPSTPESSRPATGFIISTGHGPATRMYDPNFASMRPQETQYDRSFSAPTLAPTTVGDVGLNTERMKMGDKGKGKAVLREDTDQPPRLSPDDEISSPDRKKSEATFTRVGRKGVNRIRRASPNRPEYVDCPLCKCRISNHRGTVGQHVEECPSSQVQAVRDYQGGPNRNGMNSPVRIACPSCRGRKRKFGTLSRWADHLSHVHGEWITYECDIPGCGEKFVSEWDCNEHKRREHRN